jgi:hypothetical protein
LLLRSWLQCCRSRDRTLSQAITIRLSLRHERSSHEAILEEEEVKDECGNGA